MKEKRKCTRKMTGYCKKEKRKYEKESEIKESEKESIVVLFNP